MIESLKLYSAMKDSGVLSLGTVPISWNVRRLRNLAEIRVSNVDKHTHDGEVPIRLCNYVDVYKNHYIRSSMPFMRATATRDEIARFRLAPGDVLITKDSEIWNDIGVPALVVESADDLVSGYHLALLRPVTDCILGSYLFRALQSVSVAYQFHVEANGVTRYGLSHGAIKSAWLPVPSVSEQAAIVRFLDHVDRRILRYVRAKQKVIKLLQQQKQVVTQRAVLRGLNPGVGIKSSGVQWLGEVPEHWTRYRLKVLLRLLDVRSTTGAETLLSLRRDHGIVPYAEHFSRPFQAKTLVGFKIVEPDQLVVNRLQANNGLIFRSPIRGLVSPDYSVFAPRHDLELIYLQEVLRSQPYRTHFRRESTGLGTGTAGFLRLYDDRFLETPVFLPPLPEQRSILNSIAQQLQTTNAAIEKETQALARVDEYSTRLITDAVTGKVDVREAAAQLPEQVESVEPADEGDVEADFQEADEDVATVAEEAEA